MEIMRGITLNQKSDQKTAAHLTELLPRQSGLVAISTV